MRRLLFAILPLLVAAESGAQVIRRGNLGGGEPSLYISGGASLTEGWSVIDGSTGSRWDFGNATQYQASIERVANGASFGLRGATGMVPLRYNGADADARVSQYLAAVHVSPGRVGFRTVLEIDAGATVYSDFRDRATGAKLLPSSDPDFTFSFGYGFGYGISNSFGIEVVRDLTTVLHQKTGLSAGDDSSVRINSTRLMGRLAFGS